MLIGGLSPKLKEWLFKPFLLLALAGLPGLFVVLALVFAYGPLAGSEYGASIGIERGFVRADGSWTGNVYMLSAGIFAWLMLGLLAAQQRRFHQELLAADGQYYVYDDHRLRVVFDADDNLWIYAIDLAAVLGKSRKDLPRMLLGFTELELTRTARGEPLLSHSGVERLLAKRSGRAIARFQRYLLDELFPVHEKRKAMHKLHYQSRPLIHAGETMKKRSL